MTKKNLWSIIILVLVSCKTDNRTSKLPDCIKKEEIEIRSNFYFQENKDLSLFNILRKVENILVEEGYLRGTDKVNYIQFIKRLDNKNKLQISNELKNKLSPNEYKYLKNAHINLIVLKCARDSYFTIKNKKFKQQLYNYIAYVDTLQKFEGDQTDLLMKMAQIFDDEYYKKTNNRLIVLYQIIFFTLHPESKFS